MIYGLLIDTISSVEVGVPQGVVRVPPASGTRKGSSGCIAENKLSIAPDVFLPQYEL
jgi:hypothetical protein